jgi:hypothetical protein
MELFFRQRTFPLLVQEGWISLKHERKAGVVEITFELRKFDQKCLTSTIENI